MHIRCCNFFKFNLKNTNKIQANKRPKPGLPLVYNRKRISLFFVYFNNFFATNLARKAHWILFEMNKKCVHDFLPNVD